MPQPQDQTQALRQLYQSEDNPAIQSRELQDLWMQFRGPQGYQAQRPPDTGVGAPLDYSSLLRQLVQMASDPQHPDQAVALRHLQTVAFGLPAGGVRQPTPMSLEEQAMARLLGNTPRTYLQNRVGVSNSTPFQPSDRLSQWYLEHPRSPQAPNFYDRRMFIQRPENYQTPFVQDPDALIKGTVAGPSPTRGS